MRKKGERKREKQRERPSKLTPVAVLPTKEQLTSRLLGRSVLWAVSVSTCEAFPSIILAVEANHSFVLYVSVCLAWRNLNAAL